MRTMKLAVVCLRCKGRRVPKWQLHRAVRHVGQLTVTEENDQVLHRICRVARVIEVERRPVDLLPPLLDATLLWMNHDQMALTGFERVDTTGDYTDYAQTWLCEEARTP
jgi:hypothetical protein